MVEYAPDKHWTLLQLISECTYENYLRFRWLFIAPHMNTPFVEEDYNIEMWNEYWEHGECVQEISRGHGKTEDGIHMRIYLGLCQPYNPRYEKALGAKHRMTEFLLISSDSTSVSEVRDRLVGYFLADDSLMRFVPDGVAKKDSNSRFNTSKINLNNGTVFHFRALKTKRGLHVDDIWLDDPTTESSTLTDKQTVNFLYGAIMPMGTAKQAYFTVTGTPIRQTDILNTMVRTGAYYHRKRPAYNDSGELLSKRFTKEMLEGIKRKIGSMKFSAEYLLNPIDDGISLIKKSWIDSCKSERHSFIKNRGGYDTVVAGVDFSFGDTEYSRGGGDYFVMVVIGLNGVKKQVLNVYRRKDLSTVEQLAYVKELNAVYKFDNIALEFNSIRALAGNLRDLNLPFKLYNTGNVDEKDKKNPDFSRVISVSKRNLIIRQGIQLENELVILPYKDDVCRDIIDLYCEEATSWALEEDKIIELGRHPDIPIAFAYALECVDDSMFVIQW